MKLGPNQRGVAVAMATAVIVAGLALSAPLWPGFPREPLSDGEASRLAAGLAAMVAFWVCVGIARLAFHRFTEPADLDAAVGGPPTERARVLQAVLQNTLEQGVLAMLVYGAWLGLAPVGWQRLPVVMGGLFCVGRLLFLIGYRHGALGRGLGFTLTFYPTVALLGALPMVWLVGG